jgi:hypothetical protein
MPDDAASGALAERELAPETHPAPERPKYIGCREDWKGQDG